MKYCKRAIVLSGGGARGAYQVGVWKALRRLHISYQIVTGTSVGALNGIFMVQKDYYACMKLWKNIQFDSLYQESFPTQYKTVSDLTKIYKKYAINFVKNGGIDISKLEALVYALYRPNRFFRSSIDYGIITYNWSSKKSVSKKKNEMTKESLPEYVIASASCYPVFPKKDIDGDLYIDGGYSDNLPINLAIELGATEVIAIDLNAIGRKKKVKYDGIPITYIEPRNEIVPFLVFHPDASKQAIRYGYHDTMKQFHKLDGNKYTFRKNHLLHNFERYGVSFVSKINTLFEPNKKDTTMFDTLFHIAVFRKIMKDGDMKQAQKTMNETIEYLGGLFEIDASYIYSIEQFHVILLQKLEQIEQVNQTRMNERILTNAIHSLLDKKQAVKYFYDLFIKENGHSKKKKELYTFALLHAKELLGSIYLYIISEKMN